MLFILPLPWLTNILSFQPRERQQAAGLWSASVSWIPNIILKHKVSTTWVFNRFPKETQGKKKHTADSKVIPRWKFPTLLVDLPNTLRHLKVASLHCKVTSCPTPLILRCQHIDETSKERHTRFKGPLKQPTNQPEVMVTCDFLFSWRLQWE